MQYTSLGRSGLQVSRLALGTMNFGELCLSLVLPRCCGKTRFGLGWGLLSARLPFPPSLRGRFNCLAGFFIPTVLKQLCSSLPRHLW